MDGWYENLEYTCVTQKLNGDLRRAHKQEIMGLFKDGSVHFEIFLPVPPKGLGPDL
jgi:hypothetical protein